MRLRLAACTIAALTATPLASPSAQTPATPQVYSFTADPAVPTAGPAVVKVVRDGPKELVEQTLPVMEGRPEAFRTRLLYDFEAHTLYSQVLSDATVPCGLATYTSPSAPIEFDLISGGAEFLKLALGPAKLRQVGAEAIDGAKFRIMEGSSPPPQPTTVRLWIAETGGYPIKIAIVTPGGKLQPYVELKQLSFAKPPASTFDPPKGCLPAGTSSSSGGSASASATLGGP